MVLPNADAHTCQSVCERIVASLAATPHDIGSGSISVTISIGFATQSLDAPFESVDALLRAADQALYTAKLTGRSKVVRYDATESAPMVRFR